jgi:hypothetical protein
MVIIKARRPPDPGPDRSMVRWTKAVAWFTGVLALFTFLLALVAALQLWAFVQSERAFLSVVGLSIGGTDGGLPKASEPHTRVVLQMRNGGRNTAFIDRFRFDAAYGAMGPLPQEPQYLDEPQFGVPRPIPGDTTVPVNDGVAKTFTPDEIDGFRTSKGRFSLYGYVKYNDAYWLFGARTTGYCFTYSSREAQWTTCPEPNYTYAN